jgi:hypothetical protein
LVRDVAEKQRQKGRIVMQFSLKSFKGVFTLDDLLGVDWLRIVVPALQKLQEQGMKQPGRYIPPLIIIDDIQKVFDKKGLDSDGFCSPLLHLFETSMANVIFVSSEGSIMDKMQQFSGFTGRLEFYDWKRVSSEEMRDYIERIAKEKPIHAKNKHVNVESAQLFAEKFDGWFTGLNIWIKSGSTIDAFIEARRREVKRKIDSLWNQPEFEALLKTLCECKDGYLEVSQRHPMYEQLSDTKLFQVQRSNVSFHYPLIKEVAEKILKEVAEKRVAEEALKSSKWNWKLW